MLSIILLLEYKVVNIAAIVDIQYTIMLEIKNCPYADSIIKSLE